MRILLVHNYYRSGAPGGEDIVFEQERDLLISAGHDVRYYHRSNDEVDESSLSDKIRAAREMVWSKRTSRELAKLVAEFRPSVAHFHNTFPLITASAYRVCRDAGVPIFQTVHNFRMVCSSATLYRSGAPCFECSPDRLWPAVVHRCYRGSALGSLAVARTLRSYHTAGVHQWVDQFFCLSKFSKDRLVSFGIDPSKISIKPNFVPDATFRPIGDRDYVLFAGRLAEEKGVRLLIDAWKNLGSLRLVMIGDGPMRPWIEAQIREQRLPIDLVGNVTRDRVADFMAKAHSLVVPSICQEAGVPLVAIEAWRSGVPVIASRAGSLAAAVSDGLALGFREGCAEDLALQVDRMTQDAVLMDKLIASARARYESVHQPSCSLERLTDHYARVAVS
jgi:glycosyltransferase involved in cell wall biosynthesis